VSEEEEESGEEELGLEESGLEVAEVVSGTVLFYTAYCNRPHATCTVIYTSLLYSSVLHNT
jgi:hypothetical protein